jgi:hypothetical protein
MLRLLVFQLLAVYLNATLLTIYESISMKTVCFNATFLTIYGSIIMKEVCLKAKFILKFRYVKVFQSLRSVKLLHLLQYFNPLYFSGKLFIIKIDLLELN